MVWSLVLASAAVPPRTRLGGRLPRDLCASAAHDQTHLLPGGDVRHGSPETLGPAEPTDAGTARMADRARAAAAATAEHCSTLCGQLGGTQCRSTSGDAWQVEVAPSKVVTAANRLTGKKPGAGARWRWRNAAPHQMTALCYVPDAVGAKNVETAAADTDARALVEALQTTKRTWHLSEQRVSTPEACLTRQQNLQRRGE